MEEISGVLFNKLLEELTVALKQGNLSIATQLWIHASSLPLSFHQLTKVTNLGRRLLKAKGDKASNKPPIRLAILGNSTSIHVKNSLQSSLAVRGYSAEFYESPFNSLEQDIYNPESGLYAFKPTHVLLWTSAEGIPVSATRSATEEYWERQVKLWALLKERLPKCQLLQTTFAIPSLRPLGHLETRMAISRHAALEDLNRKMRTEAPADVAVVDLDYLASWFGKGRWFDRRFWFHSKHAFSIDATSLVSNELLRVLVAGFGQSYKCLVLDLDNTLWGGVIGDDGLEGIHLGENPLGEAFSAFQAYVKSLKERGVILAVCSKNSEDIAKLPFLKHSHMLLKEADIACFVANWNNKADNIRSIASTLEIGIDSIVFCDDNPAERKLVRDLLPEVFTVEMPEDPSDYVGVLDSLGLFDVTQLTEEDFERAQQYHANTERKALAKTITSLEDYLRDLAMKGYVEPVKDPNLERPLQLINKSNQFNLMTNRYTQSEFRDLLSSSGIEAVSLRLVDRFGDNGTIAVLVVEKKDNALVVRDWVMSCRVLSRGMEQFTFNTLLGMAQRAGVRTIVGSYRPTPKNKLVAGLFKSLGFALMASDASEERYSLEVSTAAPMKHFIELCPKGIS